MVLSENNEPFKEHSQSGELSNPDSEEILDTATHDSNPGDRLRSIEMAASKLKDNKVKQEFLKIFNKTKIVKVKLLLFYQKYRSTFSIIFNVFLLIVILLLSKQVYSLKKMVVGDVLGGLYMNIEELDKAKISTNLVIQDNIQLDFPLQLSQDTELILTSDTVINGARISISTGALNIVSAPASIVLPAGTHLPVQVNMAVPVKESVPLNINVPINIPLAETEMNRPFTNILNMIEPHLISYMDGSFTWQEEPACKVFGFICNWWFK